MKPISFVWCLAVPTCAFLGDLHVANRRTGRFRLSEKGSADIEYIKEELLKYLEIRKSMRADDAAKGELGKTIGGTKGNAVLEYISGSPNKETVIDTPSNPLDYDELTKYGFSHLVTPIMNAGGRIEMYRILGLPEPEFTPKPKTVTAPKLIIDRTGELTDPNRYTGLKLGQVIDDNAQAEALERVLREGSRKKDTYDWDRPFSDKRNVSKQPWTPDWTPERLDEWGKQQGRAVSWAREAAAGRFVSDPDESFDLTAVQRGFSILTALLLTMSFGKATTPFLTETTGLLSDESQVFRVLDALQGPALALLVTSVGSSIVCGSFARDKNRNQWIWVLKGLLGGPLTLQRLRELPALITQGETDARAEEAKNAK